MNIMQIDVYFKSILASNLACGWVTRPCAEEGTSHSRSIGKTLKLHHHVIANIRPSPIPGSLPFPLFGFTEGITVCSQNGCFRKL